MLEGGASTLLASFSAKDPAMRIPALCLVLLAAAVPAAAQVAPPPMVNAPAPGAGAFGSGLSGPAPGLGPAPQVQAAPPPLRAQNLDLYGTPFTEVQPGSGLPYTPPQTYGVEGPRRR